MRSGADKGDRLDQMERESWENYRWEKHQLRRKALGLVEKITDELAVGWAERKIIQKDEDIYGIMPT